MTERLHDAAPAETDLLADVERLIGELQQHPDAEVGRRVMRLLEGIDAVHRAALTHLMDAIRGMAGDAFVNRLVADPAIRMLLMSYDLVAVDRRMIAEEAVDLVRGHLHAHGVDVEVLEVVGGVVYVRLHGVSPGQPRFESAIADLEEALKESFVGFQELVTRDRQAAVAPAATIPLGSLRRAHVPLYKDALASGALAAGAIVPIDLDGTAVLLARVDGDVHAVTDACGDSPLPLRFGTLEGGIIRCSFHGCRYDVRTGKRLDAGFEADRIAVFPVKEDQGRILVAVGVQSAAGGR
ncbi:MAG: Rieske 2Fe-2S domain-containing protein [Vicinamibacterales bacterium]